MKKLSAEKLLKKAQHIIENINKLEKERQDKEKELGATISDLCAMIQSGETVMDPYLDFVLAVHRRIDYNLCKIYSQLWMNLVCNELILIIKEEKVQEGIIHDSGYNSPVAHRRSLYLGIIPIEKQFSVDIENRTWSIPTKKYIFCEDVRTEKIIICDGSITSPFDNAIKPLSSVYQPNQKMFWTSGVGNRLEIIAGNTAIEEFLDQHKALNQSVIICEMAARFNRTIGWHNRAITEYRRIHEGSHSEIFP